MPAARWQAVAARVAAPATRAGRVAVCMRSRKSIRAKRPYRLAPLWTGSRPGFPGPPLVRGPGRFSLAAGPPAGERTAAVEVGHSLAAPSVVRGEAVET